MSDVQSKTTVHSERDVELLLVVEEVSCYGRFGLGWYFNRLVLHEGRPRHEEVDACTTEEYAGIAHATANKSESISDVLLRLAESIRDNAWRVEKACRMPVL